VKERANEREREREKERKQKGVRKIVRESEIVGRHYGVALVSRIDKIISLFCRILSLL